MMNVNIFDTQMFPYLEGESIKGSMLTLTINDMKIEKMQSHGGKMEEKYVLYFTENAKGFVLNKTNAKRIAQMYGPTTGDWKGKQITLTTESVRAFGETHNALRVVPGVVSQGVADDPENWMELNPSKVDFFQHAKLDLGLSVEDTAAMLKNEGYTSGYDPALASEMWSVLLRARMPQDDSVDDFGIDGDIVDEEDAQNIIDDGIVDNEEDEPLF